MAPASVGRYDVPLILASCATAPPSGQECNDTVAMGSISDWVLISFLTVLVVVALVVVVGLVRTRRR
ncbi:hypothetical protein ACRAWB_10330 [Leifsonia poae]|uniref:hypothetical protein n=1 Tax=Leifsonia poae TaxID=110933 RepID=UPI003D693AE6